VTAGLQRRRAESGEFAEALPTTVGRSCPLASVRAVRSIVSMPAAT